MSLGAPSSRSTAATSRAVTSSHSRSSGASTITRTTGSVPDGRMSTRPRPSSAASSCSAASQTPCAPSSASRSATRTFTSRCGSFRIASRSARSRAAERLHREQRGGDAVARGHEVRVDDVARLLAAERPAAAEQLDQHVAVTDRRGRDRRCPSRPSPGGSRSSSSR